MAAGGPNWRGASTGSAASAQSIAPTSVVLWARLHYPTAGDSNELCPTRPAARRSVRHTASAHWIVYWPGHCASSWRWRRSSGRVFCLRTWADWVHWLAALLAVAGVVFLIREWFGWWSTEIAVTNLRVIYKTGLIKRTTNEMNMDKVESVKVEQSVLGRILDYGKVSITGTGAGLEALARVANPIELRNSITGVAHNHDGQSPQNRHLGKPSAIPASPARRCSIGAKSARATPITSRASPRPSSRRCARSPASPTSRISSSTMCRANGWSS